MSDYIIINGELYHYGVPGMKWGVRKGSNTASSNNKSKKNEKPKLDSKFKSKLFKELDDDFGGPDMVDDGEFLELVVREKIKKYNSTKKEPYVQVGKDTVDSIISDWEKARGKTAYYKKNK